MRVALRDRLLADTRTALRVLETASPPTWYLPAADVDRSLLEPAPGTSHCEWKGAARYWSCRAGDERVPEIAWDYPAPFAEFARLLEHFAFYPARVDCFVDDERVLPQPGGFYGGWVTADVLGPFKGEPGTGHW